MTKNKKKQQPLSTSAKCIVVVTIIGIAVLLYLMFMNARYMEVSRYVSNTNNRVQLYVKRTLAGETTDDIYDSIANSVSVVRLGNDTVLSPSKINKEYYECVQNLKTIWEKISKANGQEMSDQNERTTFLLLSEDFVDSAQKATNIVNAKISFRTSLMRWMLVVAILFIGYIAYILPIQKRHMDDVQWKNEELSKKAYIDVRTGLPNKNRCEEVLNALDVRTSKCCIVMFDLNDLKKVNDTMGHAYGDAMIKGFADILHSVFRGDDFVGRYGGDEFIAVLQNVEVSSVQSILKRVSEEVRRHNSSNKNIFISYAYGFAHSDQVKDETVDRLLNRADNNMYIYKKEYKRRNSLGAPIKEADRARLASRIFDGFSETTNRRYLFMCDMSTGLIRWSKNAVEYFGLPGEFIEESIDVWGELIHPDDRAKFFTDMKAIFLGKKNRHDMDYRMKNRMGEYVSCTCRGVVTKGNGDEHDLFLGHIFNHGISDHIDAITNLQNIYSFWTFLREQKGSVTPHYVLLLGVGNFSTVNAIYGYEFGNQVLRSIAELIQSRIEDCGYVFRMEGTKFACYLQDVDRDYVVNFYAGLKETLSAGFTVEDAKLAFPLSGGVVKISGDYNEYSVHAGMNHAMQQSKYDSNGDLIFFNSENYEETKQNLAIMNELRNCIKNNCENFYLVYQPVVDAKTEELLGAEALLRWKNDTYGEIPPGVFVPWIENDPVFFDLGNWIIETACTQMLPFLKKYPDFLLNVNISYSQLARKTFKNAVVDIIRKVQFPGRNLCLELTERCRQLETSYLEHEIQEMKKFDIKFALDDFGTGFSSLNLLSQIPIDTLKIDRGFVYDIQDNHTNQAIVKAVTNCADELNIQVCVEGIEDEVLAEFVKQYRVNSYQGYYYSKPKKLDDFIAKYI